MKKYVFLSLLVAIAPNVCLGASSRVTTLMREKQRKMEELEKCTGSKKGLMIAGVSTLGLTAVGVAGNIAEASKIKSLDSEINKTDRNIEKTRNEIEQIKREKIEREERERQLAQEQLEEHNRTHALSTVLAEDINNITQNSGVVGGIAYTRGYTPNQLNGSLGSQLKSAMSLFMEKCMDLAVNKTDHIKSVNITASDKSYWDNFISNGTLDANTILENLNQNTIKQCQATECDDANYKVEAGKCVYTTAGASVVGTVSDADENLIDVTIVDGDSDQHTDGDGVVAVVQGVVQNGTETACSTEKLTELHAESGNMVDGVCIITKCLGDLAKSSDSRSCACPSNKVAKANDATKCECPTNLPRWDTGQKKCVAATPVQRDCESSYLQSHKAKKGVLGANGSCKVTECLNNTLTKNQAETACECPADKKYWNAKLNKCLKYNTSVGGHSATESNVYEWQAGMFNYDEAGFSGIKGTSACLNTNETGNYTFVVDTSIQSSGRENTGGNCYCKMTFPVQSEWIFIVSKWGEENCWKHCARECSMNAAGSGVNGINFKNALFGSVAE